MGSMRGDKSESGYFLLGYCKVNKNLRFRNMNPKKICTDGRKHHTTLAPCPSPDSKIMVSVRVTPYIHNQLEEIAKSNGVNVSVVVRAFLLYGIERAESNAAQAHIGYAK